MESFINLKTDRRRKKTIAIIFGVFLGTLLLLTFFSNTIMSLTLPKVITEKPRKGKLETSLSGNGLLAPQQEMELANDFGLKVRKLLVKEGDSVRKGQALAQYDNKDAERQLLDERARLQQLRMAMEKGKEDFIAAQRNGDDSGVREAKRSLEGQKLDIGIQERKIQGLEEKLSQQRELRAPFDGIVAEVLISEDQPPSLGQPMFRIVNAGKGYKLEIPLTNRLVTLFKAGDTVPLVIETEENKKLNVKGRVMKVESRESYGKGNNAISAGGQGDAGADAEAAKSILVLAVQGEGIQGGQTASLSYTKSSAKEMLLLPNKAIKEDADGKYVLTVEENKGALGNTFTVRKSYFHAADANELETAVERGLAPDVRIVTESSEPLQENNRVRLE
ncbi:efflux RND transporter periplasmic adaptor subunit [Cohnella phaseoli]|uniref:Multidrug efflux pump subunit AcrA (Membrane-fusion protein) n=1 Tax=Cohnella phaseoli TaxID=456490 RepID=A0A3D9JMT3_9BACL|nr:biotin/lipoyl-binding protein [Cohnella phaseoli]RED75089.1 multidrug efflux pump subunit AcrA (membrane-fusion protein) [Cohnella phaseoli]